MTGKIIKGIAGFYYVYVEETKEAKETATGGTLYECKAKGTFRKQKIKPLVGDMASRPNCWSITRSVHSGSITAKR